MSRSGKFVYSCNECEYTEVTDAIDAQIKRDIHERVTGHKRGQIDPYEETREEWAQNP